MYDYTLHRGRTHFSHCLQAFSTKEILKRYMKEFFKINGKQRINMFKKGDYVRFKDFERKINSPFVIYEDLESILVPEDNGEQNPYESHSKKHQKHVACSYSYKLV